MLLVPCGCAVDYILVMDRIEIGKIFNYICVCLSVCCVYRVFMYVCVSVRYYIYNAYNILQYDYGVLCTVPTQSPLA